MSPSILSPFNCSNSFEDDVSSSRCAFTLTEAQVDRVWPLHLLFAAVVFAPGSCPSAMTNYFQNRLYAHTVCHYGNNFSYFRAYSQFLHSPFPSHKFLEPQVLTMILITAVAFRFSVQWFLTFQGLPGHNSENTNGPKLTLTSQFGSIFTLSELQTDTGPFGNPPTQPGS